MLSAIKAFFENRLDASDADDESAKLARVELASAALMIELINTDQHLDERESAEFVSVLKNTFNIADEDLAEIVELARQEAASATSLYEFTRLVNDHYDYDQKLALVQNMWRIAFADNDLDRYEDNMIRKVCDLIYVSHKDFIKTKLKMRPA